ncbi:ScbA/BarX family gamma-butyrolactone biosynthesis protein [Streptomyces sp. NBC_01429]|uniref:ScbA/BarX family gamma-butyrolactone biosynthesis protein n=1 Tax=Streptomyces sp. NBC_01429 TaxID=2903862 RepID=UPI002E2C68D2|nr:ScbA/BarX family gamma-butyrolactone biosynthesis protein [Streptomyces sp. NBC_01429]
MSGTPASDAPVDGGPARGAPARPRPLSWSRTVPRELVHRDSVAEVLLTDVRRARGGGFEAAASWPRSHPTFPRDGADLHSPLMIVETLRQLGIYVPLRYFGVAPSDRLVITDLYFETDPRGEPVARSGATKVDCRVLVGGVRRGPGGEVTGLRLQVSYRADGVVFARAGGGSRFLSAERYDAVRAGGAGAPEPARGSPGAPVLTARPVRPAAHRLGVNGAHDVMIAVDRATLLVEPADPRHPYFFDHATDHLPGMIVLEAARQAAAVASGGRLMRPSAGRLKTARFIEYAPAARVLCVPHHTTCVFRFLQGGEQKAFGVLSYQ